MIETVVISGINLYEQYGLILAQKTIGVPKKKIITIEVPGRDGKLDITDQLYNVPKYENRVIELSFISIKGLNNNDNWGTQLSRILNQFHGKNCEITFSSDPGYKYKGRCSVDDFQDKNSARRYLFNLDCEPYKYSVNDETEKML